MTKSTRTFISISGKGDAIAVSGVIKNDHEQQLDCDYHKEFKHEWEGGTPTRYEVTVTVKELGPL